MLVVHGSIIAISGLELFIGCTVHIVSFTDREDRGTYDSFDKNPYKSRLGLDGLTR